MTENASLSIISAPKTTFSTSNACGCKCPYVLSNDDLDLFLFIFSLFELFSGILYKLEYKHYMIFINP